MFFDLVWIVLEGLSEPLFFEFARLFFERFIIGGIALVEVCVHPFGLRDFVCEFLRDPGFLRSSLFGREGFLFRRSGGC